MVVQLAQKQESEISEYCCQAERALSEQRWLVLLPILALWKTQRYH